jgi:GNAT superfamily N-acetyltransferase
MDIITSDNLATFEKEDILEIWNNEFPINMNFSDVQALDNYLHKLTSLKFTLVKHNKRIKGWCFTFNRDGERWFVIALSSDIKSKGFGKKIIESLKLTEKELTGWMIDIDSYKKINGEVYFSPIKFYQKLGFSIFNDIRFTNDKLQSTDIKELSAVKIKWTTQQ